MKEESFHELKKRQGEELRAIPFFAAFSQEQFKEGVARLGLPPGSDEVASVGWGCFVRKADLARWRDLGNAHYREIREWVEGCLGDEGRRPLLVRAIADELANREYGYTRDWAQVEEALAPFGLDLEDTGEDARLADVVGEACARCVEDYERLARKER